MSTCNSVESSSSAFVHSKPANLVSNLLIALSVISLIGSLIATGCLFQKLGYWSFSIGGGGIAFAILLGVGYCGYLARKPTPQERLCKSDHPQGTQPSLGPQPKSPLVPYRENTQAVPFLSAQTEAILPTHSFSNDMIHPYMKYLVALYYPQVTLSEEEHGFPIGKLETRIRSLNQSTENYQKFNYPFCISVTDSHFALVYINRTKRRVEYYSLKAESEHPEIPEELRRIAEILTKEEPGKKSFELKIRVHTPCQNQMSQSGLWVLYCLKDRLDDQKLYKPNELKIPELVSKAIEKYETAVLQSWETAQVLLQQAQEEERVAYSKHYADPKEPKKYLDYYEEDCRKIPPVKRLAQLLRGFSLDPSSSQFRLAPQAPPNMTLREHDTLWAKKPAPAVPAASKTHEFERHWLTSYDIYLYMQFLAAAHYPQITLPQSSSPIHTGALKAASLLCCPITSLMKHIQMLNQETLNYKNVNYPFVIHVTGNHWTLVYINRIARTIEYYDSKIHYGASEYPQIVTELKRIAGILTQEEPGLKPFQLELKITTLLQPDSFQCGIWVLYFLDKILNEKNFEFNKIPDPKSVIAHYRIQVFNRLSQMKSIETQAEKQELDAYIKYYKDKTIGSALYYSDRRQQKCLWRWKQLAEGKLLSPQATLS